MVIGWKGVGVHPHPPLSPARADFSIMMGCTPEIGNRHSVFTLWFLPSKDCFCIRFLFRLDFALIISFLLLNYPLTFLFKIPAAVLLHALYTVQYIWSDLVLHSLHGIHPHLYTFSMKKMFFLQILHLKKTDLFLPSYAVFSHVFDQCIFSTICLHNSPLLTIYLHCNVLWAIIQIRSVSIYPYSVEDLTPSVFYFQIAPPDLSHQEFMSSWSGERRSNQRAS